MKRVIFLILGLLLILPSVDAAHYFNQQNKESGYHTDGNFQLIHVKADRSMGIGEKEDRFYIDFRFTADVTRVNIKVTALDGENDGDTREIKFRFSSMSANQLKNIYCGNLPTYVDNLVIEVTYYIGEAYHTITIYIYSLTPNNQGSGTFAVSSDAIPDEYIRTDGEGRWDSDSGIGQIGSPLLKMVTAPYNLIKWITNVDVLIALGGSLATIYIGMLGLSYTRHIGFIVITIVGVIVLSGVILDGFSSII